MKLEELDLKNLGFKKVKVSKSESGGSPFYYYTLDIGDDYEKFSFITNALEKKGDEIFVMIFDYDVFKFTETTELSILINLLQNNISKNKL